MVGRPPKPSAIRIIEGMRGHRPLPKEPKHSTGIPEKPRKMSAGAHLVWDELVDDMDPRIFCRTDRRALWQLAEDEAILAEAYAGFWKMARMLKKKAEAEGRPLPAGEIMGLLTMQNGRSAMRAVRDLAARVIIERREFGLTPSSRARVAVGGGRLEGIIDPLELKLCGPA